LQRSIVSRHWINVNAFTGEVASSHLGGLSLPFFDPRQHDNGISGCGLRRQNRNATGHGYFSVIKRACCNAPRRMS
jgi:hypothetical protein